MKKILGLVVLSLFAISASAADLMASSAAPTVTQNIVVEGAACPGVGATGFSSTGLLLSCQSGRWAAASGIISSPPGSTCGIQGDSGTLYFACQSFAPKSSCPLGYNRDSYKTAGGTLWTCVKS